MQVNEKINWRRFSFVSLKSWILKDVILKLFKQIWVLKPPTLQNELRQVSFLCIPRTTTSLHLFGRLRCTCKKVSWTTTKKMKQRFSNKNKIMKNLLKSRRKSLGVLRLNKIMSNLLTISKYLQLNCYQIQQLPAIVKNSMVNKKHCFEHAERFHVLHFTYHLRD